jgi:UDP-GlcNAc3NAcA epimerase
VKLVVVVGVRPQFIKLAPLLEELRSRHSVTIVNTGQHYERSLSEDLFSDLRTGRPDVLLEIHRGSRIARLSKGISELEVEIDRMDSPDAMVVIGDSDPAYTGSVVANVLGLPLAHVEAGLRSGDQDQPEERNRIVIDAASSICFAPSPNCADNLHREGKRNVVTSGDLHLDALRWTMRKEIGAAPGRRADSLNDGFVLVTTHRAATLASEAKLEAVVTALMKLDMNVVWLAHPSARIRLEETGLLARIMADSRFKVLGPQTHSQFVRLLRSASLVMTDSGGAQREAYFLRSRCVVLRSHTEFPETIGEGHGLLVEPGTSDLYEAAQELLRRPVGEPDLESFGSGHAARRISETLERLDHSS